jgi:hypothetical protein
MNPTVPLLMMISACTAEKPEIDGFRFTPSANDSADDATPSEWDTGLSWSDQQLTGPTLDDGFGSALATSATALWVGAPHGEEGVVYRVVDNTVEEALSGPGRLGATLATGPHGLLIGAPLANDGLGEVIGLDREIIVEGSGSTGLAIFGGPKNIVAHGAGWTTLDGVNGAALSRPSSVAWDGEFVGVGMARGEVALEVEDRTWSRPENTDLAGFALAAADIDGDGVAEWIVGAPGANKVHILDARDLSLRVSITHASGSFGFALATCDANGDGTTDLIIGAPSANENAGEVHLLTDPVAGTIERTWSGETPGSFLGSAITCGHGILAMGAPGGGAIDGMVWVVR